VKGSRCPKGRGELPVKCQILSARPCVRHQTISEEKRSCRRCDQHRRIKRGGSLLGHRRWPRRGSSASRTQMFAARDGFPILRPSAHTQIHPGCGMCGTTSAASRVRTSLVRECRRAAQEESRGAATEYYEVL